MEQKLQMDAQDQKQDRTLAITCTPTLVWISSVPPYNIQATATYAYNPVGSNPAMLNRVQANGDIDLNPLPQANNFNNNVDITMTLDTSKLFDSSGKVAVSGRWATSTEYSGTGPVTGFCWFCAMQDVPRRLYDKTPITINGMTTTRLGDTQVLINDDTPGAAPDYAYCLGLVLPDFGGYYITLDPVITGKGNTNKFMLKD